METSLASLLNTPSYAPATNYAPAVNVVKTPAPADPSRTAARPKTDDQQDDNQDSQGSFRDMVTARLADKTADATAANRAADDKVTSDRTDDDGTAATRTAPKEGGKAKTTVQTTAPQTPAGNAAQKAASAAAAATAAANAGTTATTTDTDADTAAATETPLDGTTQTAVSTMVNTLFGTTGGNGQPVLNAASRKKLTDTIDSLLTGLPADQRQAALTSLQTFLGQQGKGLTTDGGAAAQSGAQALIAAGLTPQQLTDLTNTLNNLQGGANGTGGAGDMTVGTATPALAAAATTPALPATAQLTAPTLKRDPIFSTRTAPIGGAAKTAATGATQANAAKTAAATAKDTTAQMNALTGSSDATDDGTGLAGASDRAAHPFDDIMKIFEQSQGSATGTAHATTTTPALSIASAKTTATAVLKAISSGATVAAAGVSTDAASAAQTYPDGSDWSGQQGAAGILPGLSGMSVTGNAVMTSLVTTASTAGAAHPATQAVAETIIRAADDNDSSDITMHLDPAELGKVSVRMLIGKDQSVKAHLVVEKPETYLMLQRDQHVLQKALQDTGLDASAGALSFELSQGGMNFNQQNREGNASGGGTGSSSSNSEVGTVLETTMNWNVDQATGQTHYNILA